MKKLMCTIIIYNLIFGICFGEEQGGQQNTELRKFIVTAYYSPLPDQSFYLRGSYEADIILNGKGTNGASGKSVYSGMIAAPKNYTFGTKIYLDGIGIGTVDDRGGAIVSSGSRGYDHDRLDIWMGYGEQGLKRALTWGKREIVGKIIEGENLELPSFSIDEFKVGYVNINSLKNNNTVGKNYESKENISISVAQQNIIPLNISKKSSEEDIKKIKQILKDVSYFSGEIDGKYDNNLLDSIIDFQLDNKLIKSKKDYGAGYYGAKTKLILKQKYISFLDEQEKKKQEEIKKEKELAKIQNQVKQMVAEFGSPKLNEIGVHIRKLQKVLKLLGYFEDKDTAIFGQKTQESIINYQLNKGIIKDKNEEQAGLIGPNTLKSLEEDLFKAIIDKKDILVSFSS